MMCAAVTVMILRTLGNALTVVEAAGCRKAVGHILSEDDNWVTVVTATDRAPSGSRPARCATGSSAL
jgi:hypothetical protein